MSRHITRKRMGNFVDDELKLFLFYENPKFKIIKKDIFDYRIEIIRDDHPVYNYSILIHISKYTNKLGELIVFTVIEKRNEYRNFTYHWGMWNIDSIMGEVKRLSDILTCESNEIHKHPEFFLLHYDYCNFIEKDQEIIKFLKSMEK
jgi:hypothetical protein